MPKGKERPQAKCHPKLPHYSRRLCVHCYRREYNKRYTKTIATRDRNRRLSTQGWTEESVSNARVKQNDLCAICKDSFEGVPYADHEHTEPPKPRALLCRRCNLGLGQFKDNPEILESAAEYLRNWK
jgi:hypothetical protein